MSDLVITAANVAPSDSAAIEYGTSGEALTAGKAIYRKAADGLMYKARANAATTDDASGIAMNDAPGVGQPVAYARAGTINPGATLAVGTIYVLSAAAAGGIAPVDDLVSTNYVTMLGIATAAGALQLALFTSGVQKA
jgi:hypothetical protein